MTDESGAIWRAQPGEDRPVNLEEHARRRTRELYSLTRSEIVGSVVAALSFVAVIVWRFAMDRRSIPEFGLLGVLAWVVITLYWFRDRIWSTAPRDQGALAAPGLAYYREELKRRRDHLRNEWIWHGPLVLACTTLLAVFWINTYPGFGRLRHALPLIVVLALWTAYGIARRRGQARELQRELDETGKL